MSAMTPLVTSGESVTWSPPLPPAPGFEHLVVETPGVRRHVAVIGTGEPVLLLHGFPQHWWQWRFIGPVLADHGYRAICPDLRGSGWTETDDPAIHRETQLSDVLAVMDALQVDRAHVVAHDMGAISGMQLAYEHPERVRRVLQLSVPPGFFDFAPSVIPAFRHMPKLLMHRPPVSMRYLFSPEYLTTPMTDATIAGYLDVEQRPQVLESVRRIYRGMVIPEATRMAMGHYKRITLHPPTLFAFGRADRPFSEQVVRKISRHHDRHADQVDFAFIENASHFVTDDAPDAVVQLALDWFAGAGC